jgi:hypothetical protein
MKVWIVMAKVQEIEARSVNKVLIQKKKQIGMCGSRKTRRIFLT